MPSTGEDLKDTVKSPNAAFGVSVFVHKTEVNKQTTK